METAPNLTFAARHLKFGWWCLFLFAALGMTLEMLHGFKVGWYLDVSNETRRFMFTLAHAHGVLLAVIHIALGATLHRVPVLWSAPWRKVASPLLFTAALLLPGGFFLGGFFIHDGDPGMGIFAVPVGGLALLVALFITASQPFGTRE